MNSEQRSPKKNRFCRIRSPSSQKRNGRMRKTRQRYRPYRLKRPRLSWITGKVWIRFQFPSRVSRFNMKWTNRRSRSRRERSSDSEATIIPMLPILRTSVKEFLSSKQRSETNRARSSGHSSRSVSLKAH